MKTGVAIALAIGVPATIGIVAWAVLANRIVDKVDDFGKPGGGGGSCSNVKLTQAMMRRTVSRLPDLVASAGINADSRYMDLARIMFKDMVPSCSWDDSMVARVCDNTGRCFDWQDMVARASGRSIVEISNDPEFQAWLGPLMGSSQQGGFGAMLYAAQGSVS